MEGKVKEKKKNKEGWVTHPDRSKRSDMKCIDSPAQVASHGCPPLQIHTRKPVNISSNTTYTQSACTRRQTALTDWFLFIYLFCLLAWSTCCCFFVPPPCVVLWQPSDLSPQQEALMKRQAATLEEIKTLTNQVQPWLEDPLVLQAAASFCLIILHLSIYSFFAVCLFFFKHWRHWYVESCCVWLKDTLARRVIIPTLNKNKEKKNREQKHFFLCGTLFLRWSLSLLPSPFVMSRRAEINSRLSPPGSTSKRGALSLISELKSSERLQTEG